LRVALVKPGAYLSESYVFSQLDKWNQPLEIALELRKRLRAHSIRFVRETHQKGESTPYGLNEVLSEFGRITAEALRQVYYDPPNHMREVWLYVAARIAKLHAYDLGDLHKLYNASLCLTMTGGEEDPGTPSPVLSLGAPWIIASITQGEVICARVLASNGRQEAMQVVEFRQRAAATLPKRPATKSSIVAHGLARRSRRWESCVHLSRSCQGSGREERCKGKLCSQARHLVPSVATCSAALRHVADETMPHADTCEMPRFHASKRSKDAVCIAYPHTLLYQDNREGLRTFPRNRPGRRGLHPTA